MIKRGAIVGIGTVLMIIGLGGLALLQTGVIYPHKSIGPLSDTEVKPPEAAPPESAQAPRPTAGDASPPGRGGGPPASAGLKPQEPIPVPHLGGNERRYPEQNPTGQQSAREKPVISDVPRHIARKADSQPKAPKMHPRSEPVVITFQFDPLRDRELYVARVHTGDRISVNIRRVGMADGRVYLTYTRNPDSKKGALVKVGTRPHMYRSIGYHSYERGYYVIEMKIYPGNRWNIKPRSFV